MTQRGRARVALLGASERSRAPLQRASILGSHAVKAFQDVELLLQMFQSSQPEHASIIADKVRRLTAVAAVAPRLSPVAQMATARLLQPLLSRPECPLLRCSLSLLRPLVRETTRRFVVAPPELTPNVLLRLPPSLCAPGHSSSSSRRQSEGGLLRQRSGAVRRLSQQGDTSAKAGGGGARPSSFEEDCRVVEECNLLVNASLDIPS